MHAAAIYGREPLALQHELGEHQFRILFRRGSFGIGRGHPALGILEYRHVEIGRFHGFLIEPEMEDDFLYGRTIASIDKKREKSMQPPKKPARRSTN